MTRPVVIALIILLLTAMAVALYLFDVGGIPGTEENITPLTSVEVREYQGERLSSIADFRENSIRGPQYLEGETYQLNVTGDVNTSFNSRTMKFSINTSIIQRRSLSFAWRDGK